MNGVRQLLTLTAALLLVSMSRADRTPSTRCPTQKVSPAPDDIRVPYLTTGNSAFGAYRVAPLIYSSPVTDDRFNPGARATYNLPFYGARMGFGDLSNGAVPKTYLLPPNSKSFIVPLPPVP
jgi:hypothetical protein